MNVGDMITLDTLKKLQAKMVAYNTDTEKCYVIFLNKDSLDKGITAGLQWVGGGYAMVTEVKPFQFNYDLRDLGEKDLREWAQRFVDSEDAPEFVLSKANSCLN